jgi:hypothetical protein
MSEMARLPSTTPDTSEIRLRSFVLAFVGMLCATVIGFVSEIRPLSPNSPDYGYEEARATEISSLSSATLLTNCSDYSPSTAETFKNRSDRLGVSAIAAPAAALPTANFTSRE